MTRIFAIVALTLLSAFPARAAVEVQEVTSPGGITAWLVEEHSIPFTALEIRFRGGSALDAPGKRGEINLMTGLLEEGAAGLNSQEFSAERERLATSFSYRVYDDVLSISAKFLTENRDEAVALLKTSIMDPTFDQESIDRVKNQIYAGLKSDATDPDSIAGETFDRLAWGDHPYGSVRDGTEESVAALTRDDLFEARARVLGKDRVFVSAVGDITAAELSDLIDSLLGDLSDATAPLPGRAEYKLHGGIKVVPFDTPQSVALFGHQGITRDDPDFMGAYLLNEVFGGGGFESRLMDEVREKRGLTYGISTFLAPMEAGELILGQVRSDNSKMADTIEVIHYEWEKIASEGITQEELDNAKKFLTGAYALRFDGNGPIAQIMVGMQMSDLPADYIRTRNDQINALTLEEVNRIAKRIYQPENLFFVVVGQPEGVEDTVE